MDADEMARRREAQEGDLSRALHTSPALVALSGGCVDILAAWGLLSGRLRASGPTRGWLPVAVPVAQLPAMAPPGYRQWTATRPRGSSDHPSHSGHPQGHPSPGKGRPILAWDCLDYPKCQLNSAPFTFLCRVRSPARY